jgi:hypothetical protein
MKVLISAPVKQDIAIFKAYLKHLDELIIPEGVTVDRLFCLNNCPELKQFLKPTEYIEYNSDNGYSADEFTHNWTEKGINDVAEMKNTLSFLAVKADYDYIFFVDSDLILHPNTLQALLQADKDIIAEVFWTKWTPQSEPQPNAWDFDHYGFVNGFERYKQGGVMLTGGTGACMLIKTDVFMQGVNYNPVYNVSYTHNGEDRAFCVRAAARDFAIWIDTNYPCRHLYRQSEYEQYKNDIERGVDCGVKANFTANI